MEPRIETYETREAWLAARSTGVGASDAAAILGCSPYGSALSVYADKIGLQEPSPESEAMRWGTRLEKTVLDAFSEETKRPIAHQRHTIWRHPSAPMFATLDGLQWRHSIELPEPTGFVEIKCISEFYWDDEIPLHHQVQMQHQFACSGYTWGSYVALIGGQRLVWQDVSPNPQIMTLLERKCAQFWSCVTNLEPPPVDSGDDKDALRVLFREETPGVVIDLPPEAQLWDEERENLVVSIKAAEGRKAEIEALIMAAIGVASAGRLPDALWKWSGSNGKRRLTRSKRR